MVRRFVWNAWPWGLSDEVHTKAIGFVANEYLSPLMRVCTSFGNPAVWGSEDDSKLTSFEWNPSLFSMYDLCVVGLNSPSTVFSIYKSLEWTTQRRPPFCSPEVRRVLPSLLFSVGISGSGC